MEGKWCQKGKINTCTEKCISEKQITEIRIILAGIIIRSLNLKVSIDGHCRESFNARIGH